MTRPPVAVLDYGVGNLHSAAKALDRAGAEVRVVPTVGEAAGAAGLVVPGVGAYGACLRGLARPAGRPRWPGGWRGAGPCSASASACSCCSRPARRARSATASASSRASSGASPARSRSPTSAGTRSPSGPAAGCSPASGDGTRFYFVHSYAPEPDGEAVAAVCDYGGRFAAAVEHGNLFGTQFHPEKSGAAGLALLANFVSEVRAA